MVVVLSVCESVIYLSYVEVEIGNTRMILVVYIEMEGVSSLVQELDAGC